jgi:hypothetical protein
VDCGVWTVDCGLWTVECGLWTTVTVGFSVPVLSVLLHCTVLHYCLFCTVLYRKVSVCYSLRMIVVEQLVLTIAAQ